MTWYCFKLIFLTMNFLWDVPFLSQLLKNRKIHGILIIATCLLGSYQFSRKELRMITENS